MNNLNETEKKYPEHLSKESEPLLGKKDKKVSKKKETQKQDNNPKGSLLKNARLSKGLSLENVHESTKIPMDALRAIEEGYNVRVLSPFYIKGFMKMYAKYLNVDVGEVVDDYKKEKLPKTVKYDENDFDFQQWFSKLLTKQQKQKIVLVVGVILALFILIKLFSLIGKGISSLKKTGSASVEKVVQKGSNSVKNIIVKKPPEVKKSAGNALAKIKQSVVSIENKNGSKGKAVRSTQPIIVKPAANKDTSPEKRDVDMANQSQSSISSIVQSSKKVVLTVRAQKNSWLTVKADGQTVFQSTLRLGAVETWVADKEIELSGKNISYLEFELNGKMIGTLGRKDRRAKRLVVTKDGLKVSN